MLVSCGWFVGLRISELGGVLVCMWHGETERKREMTGLVWVCHQLTYEFKNPSCSWLVSAWPLLMKLVGCSTGPIWKQTVHWLLFRGEMARLNICFSLGPHTKESPLQPLAHTRVPLSARVSSPAIIPCRSERRPPFFTGGSIFTTVKRSCCLLVLRAAV